MIKMGSLLFIFSVFGYIAHLARPYTTDTISNHKWREISNYGMGVLCVLPLGTFMFDILEDEIPVPTIRFIVSFFMSFAGFGIGVIFGHRYDR